MQLSYIGRIAYALWLWLWLCFPTQSQIFCRDGIVLHSSTVFPYIPLPFFLTSLYRFSLHPFTVFPYISLHPHGKVCLPYYSLYNKRKNPSRITNFQELAHFYTRNDRYLGKEHIRIKFRPIIKNPENRIYDWINQTIFVNSQISVEN